MKNDLKVYNKKRNFNKTTEPVGKKIPKNKSLRFVVQHHLARKDHYDFRLESDGVLLSWAVPKGPSYNPKDKRLAVRVEDHPFAYRNFEGTIPKGEYGAGTVMIWDEGFYAPVEDFNKTYNKGYLKFILKGERLKGAWTLIKFKDNNWLLIKEKDTIKGFTDITKIKTSVKTGQTMEEIANRNKKGKDILNKIQITSPDKKLYTKPDITKLEVIKYYEKVANKMLPYLENRIFSAVRCPEGIDGEKFFKKHFKENKHLKRKNITNKLGTKEDYYYMTDILGLLSEAQMNSIEFHVSGSTVYHQKNPNILVFDLDPDESVNLAKIRQGAKDLKSIIEKLNLKAYLKTSGGKGYHIIVPLKSGTSWAKLSKIAKEIAKLMEATWPNKYTSNMRMEKRKGKIFIDWVRNTEGATCVAPYSLRARKNAPVSMPIKWSELDKVKPNEINIKTAIKWLRRKDPWADFFN